MRRLGNQSHIQKTLEQTRGRHAASAPSSVNGQLPRLSSADAIPPSRSGSLVVDLGQNTCHMILNTENKL